MNQPGKSQTPAANAERNLANESSDESDVSNSQMMKGISANISTPLTRCRIETMPAAGSRYEGRSLKALMLRNSGRFLASSGIDVTFCVGRHAPGLACASAKFYCNAAERGGSP